MSLAITLEPLPEGAYIYHYRAEVKDEMGDLEGTIADYTVYLDIAPHPTDSLNARAWAYFRLGKLDLALRDANAALEHGSDEWEYFHTRGMIYRAQGQTAFAVADFQQALALEPDSPEDVQEMQDTIDEV